MDFFNQQAVPGSMTQFKTVNNTDYIIKAVNTILKNNYPILSSFFYGFAWNVVLITPIH